MSWDFQQRVFWGQRVRPVPKSHLGIRFYFRDCFLHYIENIFRGWIRPPCGEMLPWTWDICLEYGKESGIFCHPLWSPFSGIVSFHPPSSLYNKYQSHFINQDLSVLHSEGKGCLVSGRYRTPLMNNFGFKTPHQPGWNFLRPAP